MYKGIFKQIYRAIFHNTVFTGIWNINNGVQHAVFTSEDTTPTVAGGIFFITNNLQATTITDFDNETNGQVIIILFNDSNTTITDGTNILLSGGANRAFTSGETLVLYRVTQPTDKWIQIGGMI